MLTYVLCIEFSKNIFIKSAQISRVFNFLEKFKKKKKNVEQSNDLINK